MGSALSPMSRQSGKDEVKGAVSHAAKRLTLVALRVHIPQADAERVQNTESGRFFWFVYSPQSRFLSLASEHWTESRSNNPQRRAWMSLSSRHSLQVELPFNWRLPFVALRSSIGATKQLRNSFRI